MMTIIIRQTSETNFAEMPIGVLVEIDSLADFARKHDAVIDGNTLTCEWGNGEGEDVFEFEVIGE